MKKQIIFIHGGTANSNYDNFLKYLKTEPLWNLLEESPKRWKQTLREVLGSSYEVYLPSMPNKENAVYKEWKIWFERYLSYINEEVILIGHSQGGYFLAKYLSEQRLSVKLKAVYLIASPFSPDDFDGEDGGDFAFDVEDIHNISSQTENVFILHSKDDPVVPYSHALKFKENLPDAELMTFEDRNHFLQEEFPEIIESIQGLG